MNAACANRSSCSIRRNAAAPIVPSPICSCRSSFDPIGAFASLQCQTFTASNPIVSPTTRIVASYPSVVTRSYPATCVYTYPDKPPSARKPLASPPIPPPAQSSHPARTPPPPYSQSISESPAPATPAHQSPARSPAPPASTPPPDSAPSNSPDAAPNIPPPTPAPSPPLPETPPPNSPAPPPSARQINQIASVDRHRPHIQPCPCLPHLRSLLRLHRRRLPLPRARTKI